MYKVYNISYLEKFMRERILWPLTHPDAFDEYTDNEVVHHQVEAEKGFAGVELFRKIF